jgi:hypothetical protein
VPPPSKTKSIAGYMKNETLGFGGSSGPFLPQAETPKPAINAATTIKRMII